MSMTWNEARKCLKSLMNVLIIKEGDKYRPAKDTSRQDAYRALYEIQEALGTRRIEREEALLENMQDLELAISISLTRGEIIGAYEEAAVAIGLVASTGDKEAARTYEIIRAGLNALRGPTREQVERMFPGCTYCKLDSEGYARRFGAYCIWDGELKTGHCKPQKIKFCPHCSRPLTDEAVDMMLERWKEAVETYEG